MGKRKKLSMRNGRAGESMAGKGARMLGRRRHEKAQTTGTAGSSGKMNPSDPLSRSGGREGFR